MTVQSFATITCRGAGLPRESTRGRASQNVFRGDTNLFRGAQAAQYRDDTFLHPITLRLFPSRVHQARPLERESEHI